MAVPEARFGLLGPLLVEVDGRSVPVQGKKPRALLAILLLRANEVVARDALIDTLWPDDPPETAANTIQVYVSQLRRALGQDVVRTEGAGYVAAADPNSIDVYRFERLVEEAQQPSLSPEAIQRLLAEAVSLWRGAPLAELPAEAARLSELRLHAIELKIDAELQLGRHADVLAELESLTRTEPYREQFTAQLMIALYRSARQAEALAAFQRLRSTLQEELGLEPTPELRELERRILNHDPSLAATAAPLPRALLGELRKPVTVLAAAFDRRQDLDVEAEALVTARISAYASSVVAAHEGVVLQTVDGTLVALFGVPYVHEDDARRATLAALELERGLPELAAELGPQLAPELGMRAAIGTTIAVVPAPERGTTSMPASVAAGTVALARTAPTGVILLAPTTFGLVKNEVVAQPLADGPADQPSAWHLEGLRQVRRVTTAPFVGREHELAELLAGYRTVVAGGGVLERRIVGAAGVGKTRLVDELARQVGSDAAILRSACRSHGGGGGYAALGGVVDEALAFTGRARVSEILGETEQERETARVLDALSGRAEEAPDGRDVAGAVARLVTHLAGERPVIVVIDELEWAEQELLETIKAIRLRIDHGPVYFVTLGRSGELEAQEADETSATLALEALTPDDARLLSERLLEERGGAPLSEQVAASGEGNPFFIEQLAAVVAETGELPSIPPTIHALLAARLERLTADERRVLQAGAILGRVFSTDDAAAILDDSSVSLRPILAELEQRQLLASTADGGWTFRHGLLREAAYDSIPKRDRAELHERFARRLPPSSEDLLAFHLEHAWRLRSELGDHGDELDALREQAVSALLAAGGDAFRRIDLPASRSLLTRAAELMPRKDKRRAPLLIDLAETLRGSGQLREALVALDEIPELPNVDPLVVAEAHVGRLRIGLLESTAPTAEALTQLDDEMRLFEEAGDHSRLADGWFLRAWYDWLKCLAGQADVALDRAVEHARKARDRRLEWNAVHLKVGIVLFGPHPVPRGIAYCTELLERYEDVPQIFASASRGLAGLLAMEGRFEEAHDHIARDKEIMERFGLKIAAASATELYAFVHLLEDDLDAAEAELRTGCALFEEMGERTNLSTLYASLAQVRWSRGDVEEALELATRAGTYALADDLHTQVQARGPQAKALASLERFDEAERVARDAVALGQATDFLSMRAHIALDLAEVLRLAGKEPAGVSAAEEALAFYDQKEFLVGSQAARRFIERGAEPPAGTASRPAASAPQAP